ncbi:MAG: sensor histidine kinase, partial [Flammeovirgaceae bacterium]
SVKDEGPGISQEEQKMLFNKFQRLSPKPTAGESSTGLGLSIVKTLLEDLNGYIEVNSTPQVGSEFTAYIPSSNVLS